MTHIDLILPVCGVIFIVCILIKMEVLANDLMDDLKVMTHPIKVLIRIAAILLVIAGGAALAYAAFWMMISIYRTLAT